MSDELTQAVGAPLERHVRPLPAVWRLVGRANPFVPWITLERYARLEDACARAPVLKAQGKFYAVHVRAY